MRITISSNEFYRNLGKVKKQYKSAFQHQYKRWCKVHPNSIWGDGYKRCTIGNIKQENCIEGE